MRNRDAGFIRSTAADTAYRAAVVCIFLLQAFFVLSPERAVKINAAYIGPLAAAMAAYVLARAGLPRENVLRLSLGLMLWYPLTRIVNGDPYLTQSGGETASVLLCCGALLPAGFLLSPAARARLMQAVAAAYAFPMSVLAAVACVCAYTGSPWVNPLDGVNILGVNEVYSFPYRLNFMGIHPNISAAYLYAALAMLCYLFFSVRRALVKALCAAAGVACFLAILLTASNAAVLVTALMAAMAAYAAVTAHKPAGKKRALRGLAAAALALCLVAGSYPLLLTAIPVHPAQTPQAEPAPETQAEPAPEAQAEPEPAAQAEPAQALPTQTAPETQTEPAPEAQAEPEPAAQAETVNARLSMAGSSLSSRLVIFSAAFLAVEERPLTLLIGELREPAMVRSARLIDIPVQNHLHNSFLQTLAVGGGVTLLFVLALTALLVINAFRLFLCYGAPLPARLLTLLPAGLLCHAMIEALLFVDMRPPNLLFFLIAGMVMAYAAELCPAKRAARKAQTGGAADV